MPARLPRKFFKSLSSVPRPRSRECCVMAQMFEAHTAKEITPSMSAATPVLLSADRGEPDENTANASPPPVNGLSNREGSLPRRIQRSESQPANVGETGPNR